MQKLSPKMRIEISVYKFKRYTKNIQFWHYHAGCCLRCFSKHFSRTYYSPLLKNSLSHCVWFKTEIFALNFLFKLFKKWN